MSRSRRAEPRIVDPATHQRRYVSLRVAATYLEIDERTLGKVIDSGLIAFSIIGHRRKIEVAEIVAYEQRQRIRKTG